MTRERSFDDDAAGDEYADDAAYRIATGVARTARAGAYVTGGALIASAGTRGGPAPAIDNDSRNVSWSQANDPQPDEPSPTLTFPDLTADQVPPTHLPSGINPVALPDNHHFGTDAGLLPPQYDARDASHDVSMSGFHGVGLPDTEPPQSFTLPGYQQDSGFELPQTPGQSENPWAGQQPGTGAPGWQLPVADAPQWQLPGADGSGWHIPGMDGGQGWQLPDMEPGQGWQIPGGGLKLPGVDGHQPGLVNLPHAGDILGSDSHAGIFDGIGDGPIGISVGTNWAVDMHVGLDGIHFESDLKVDIAVGNVGHQLDQFTQDMGHGISHVPNGIDPNGNPLPAGANPWAEGTVQPGGQSAAAANLPGQQPNSSAVPGPHGATSGSPSGAPGSAIPGGTVAPGASAPGAALGAPAASVPGGFAAPAPAYVAPAAPAPAYAAPAAPAPVSAPAAPIVVAPVVPVAAAPAVVAPVVVAQPVVTTPLQTTIQPDAAQHPIANLLTTPGQSPLYASAANAPALFNHPGHPVPLASGQPDPSVVVAKPVSPTADTTMPKISVPKTDPLTTAPHVPVNTKVPGINDPASTKLPGITVPPVTTAPHVTVPPVTADPDAGTTRPHHPSDDTDTHGSSPTITVPDDNDPAPTHQPPVTRPSHPGGSDVTVPTVAPTVDPDLPTHQPTVTLDPTVPTVAPTVPTTQPQNTPPKTLDAPKPAKPIADTGDSGQHLMPIADDSALHPVYLVHDAGLGSHLIPDATLADSHLPLHAAFDHTLL
ncbi:hypothetical protein OHB26_02105 [Nocardia sp. NBC_01503]|uniref:hypothetical protein n=1 Tax=Nocardia sp. NBC_01503 TaxID=2975997 RepID=UPI002E7AE1A9|nr:hypothetical protein [Nocardia sp. NBC_01503]WTL33071.1 hypothetical protein OHB26_02105 [Nocardia sp. NBC_01503]